MPLDIAYQVVYCVTPPPPLPSFSTAQGSPLVLPSVWLCRWIRIRIRIRIRLDLLVRGKGGVCHRCLYTKGPVFHAELHLANPLLLIFTISSCMWQWEICISICPGKYQITLFSRSFIGGKSLPKKKIGSQNRVPKSGPNLLNFHDFWPLKAVKYSCEKKKMKIFI